jgi:hypothetical protein
LFVHDAGVRATPAGLADLVGDTGCFGGPDQMADKARIREGAAIRDVDGGTSAQPGIILRVL